MQKQKRETEEIERKARTARTKEKQKAARAQLAAATLLDQMAANANKRTEGNNGDMEAGEIGAGNQTEPLETEGEVSPERQVGNTSTLNPDTKAHVPNPGCTGEDDVENVDMDLGLTSPPTTKQLAQLITLPENSKGTVEESKNKGGTKGIDSYFKLGGESYSNHSRRSNYNPGEERALTLTRTQNALIKSIQKATTQLQRRKSSG